MTAASKSNVGLAHLRLMRAGLADVMIVQGREPPSDAAHSGARVAAA
jgi:hypothetical protein